MAVTTARLREDFEAVLAEARPRPVAVTEGGEQRLVVMTPDLFDQIVWGRRRGWAAEELPDWIVDAIATAQPSAESACFNDELGSDHVSTPGFDARL